MSNLKRALKAHAPKESDPIVCACGGKFQSSENWWDHYATMISLEMRTTDDRFEFNDNRGSMDGSVIYGNVEDIVGVVVIKTNGTNTPGSAEVHLSHPSAAGYVLTLLYGILEASAAAAEDGGVIDSGG